MFFSPPALHISENYLSLFISILFWVITAIFIFISVSKTNKSLGEKQVPLMGIMAAFIFAAQMLNFPVILGTSGHFLGGTLAAIVLGPWAAILVMTSVIALQALLFQDGGLMVMGANIFNMGILTAIIGFGLYRLVSGQPKRTRLALAGVAAWLSTVAAALFTVLQLWLSGTAKLQLITLPMLGIHVLIGIGEALITVAALSFIEQTRPDLLNPTSAADKGGRGWVVGGVLISLVAVLLSPLASADPDGLERVAADAGFLHTATNAPYQVLPDYTIPFLGNTPLSTVVAGIVGALVVMGVVLLIGKGLRKKT